MKPDQRIPAGCRLAWVGAVALAMLLAFGHPARAQYIETYFPTGVPGYDIRQGVTVLSRARPEYEPPGIRSGGFIIRPRLDEAVGFDSNPSGISGGGSSAFLRTSPGVSVNSNWSRNALGLSLSADNYNYFSQSQQNYTNWTAAIGGSYTIGRGDVTLAYAHLSLNQSAIEVGAVQSDTPVHYSVDDVSLNYTFDLGRISVTPNVEVLKYTFDNATVLGQTISQAYRDRIVVIGGATVRYSLSDQRNLLFIVQGTDSSFTNQPAGQPTNDSTGVLALAGIDYQADGPWRYRLLGGLEERSFAASQYKSRIAPIVAGQVIWTPTGLTTVTGSVARTIESPSTEDNSGYIYSTAQIQADHELYRNVILQGRAGVSVAQYLQGGGSQTSYTLGSGVLWLLNRNVRLSLNYNFTQQSGSQATTFNGVPNITAVNSSGSSRNVAILALRLAL